MNIVLNYNFLILLPYYIFILDTIFYLLKTITIEGVFVLMTSLCT